jgi:hypothetical protein
MPSRGDRSAPKFDPKQPRELRRYFSDLDSHFARASITDAAAKKANACSYVDVDTSELWESLSEFSDATKTYLEFVAAIYALYPGSEEERKWSVADMDKVVGERSRLGVISLGDLGEYYRQFLAITRFLRSKNRLSEAEQSRAFARGFQPDLWNRIASRLQLKLPDHFPDDPYKLDDIHEAARYVLHGTPSTILNTTIQTISTSTSSATSTTPTETPIKNEEILQLVERMIESFMKAVPSQNSERTNPSDRPPRRPGCHFCGSLEHFIGECQVVLEYIRAGKCKRDVDNRIVLSTGAFIPRNIPGALFKDRIDEWHRRNPNQLAAGQLMLGVVSNSISESPVSASLSLATRRTHPDLLDSSLSLSTPLTAQERIDSLERELFQLRGRRADPPVRTRAQRQADEEQDAAPKATHSPATRLQPVVEIEVRQSKGKQREDPPVQSTSSSAPCNKSPEVAPSIPTGEPPVHPFAEVNDATYAPPHERNFATPPKPANAKKPEPAYRTMAPVYDDKIATNVYDRAMDSQITLTQRELLSLSPEVRSQVREAVSAKRSAPKEATKEIHTLANDDSLPFALDDLEPDPTSTATTASTFVHSIYHQKVPPPGSLIIPDPYETYLKSLPNGQTPDTLVVAKESSALRSIYPLVDHQQHVEAIIDPGSQIIAIAEEVCIDLGLIYDPTIILNMQSANGEVDKSLGLARNVPLRIGEITLYVQIHVIRSPAYDILLGRPFDILTESVVRNFSNEDQTITIFDPNSGRRATVPTSPRGRPRRLLNKPSFLTSRI